MLYHLLGYYLAACCAVLLLPAMRLRFFYFFLSSSYYLAILAMRYVRAFRERVYHQQHISLHSGRLIYDRDRPCSLWNCTRAQILRLDNTSRRHFWLPLWLSIPSGMRAITPTVRSMNDSRWSCYAMNSSFVSEAQKVTELTRLKLVRFTCEAIDSVLRIRSVCR